MVISEDTTTTTTTTMSSLAQNVDDWLIHGKQFFQDMDATLAADTFGAHHGYYQTILLIVLGVFLLLLFVGWEVQWIGLGLFGKSNLDDEKAEDDKPVVAERKAATKEDIRLPNTSFCAY